MTKMLRTDAMRSKEITPLAWRGFHYDAISDAIRQDQAFLPTFTVVMDLGPWRT